MDAGIVLQRAEEHRRAGAEAEALATYEQAAALAGELFAPDIEARALLGAGQMHALAGNLASARLRLEDAVARSMEGGVPLVEADAWLALAHACFDDGRSKDGHDALLESMALYRDLEVEGAAAQQGLALAVRLYGEHIGVLGDTAEARHAFELARIMYSELGDDAAAGGIQGDLERLHAFSR